MDRKFNFEKSYSANVLQSIRFDEELHNRITKVVEKANKGKKKKEYSFNGFVVSACKYVLDNLIDE